MELCSLQCEKLRADAALLPGIRAELDALRRRHTSALELMGERDEAVMLSLLQFSACSFVCEMCFLMHAMFIYV